VITRSCESRADSGRQDSPRLAGKTITGKRRLSPVFLKSRIRQTPKHLRHPGPADAEVADQRCPTLELAGIEERVVVSDELERIASFLRRAFRFRFGIRNSIPGEKDDDRRAT
jgi:hypothetical protein